MLFSRHFERADGVIFIVDSERKRLESARAALRRVSRTISDIPLLLVANYKDATDHVTTTDIAETLGLNAPADQPYCKYSPGAL